jgi:hypothetical protein
MYLYLLNININLIPLVKAQKVVLFLMLNYLFKSFLVCDRYTKYIF